MFELKPVESSSISAMAHDPLTSVLRVQFTSGAVYDYQNVPATLHETILGADSVGSTFHKLIKKAPLEYPYSLVTK